MITCYDNSATCLLRRDGSGVNAETVWIDILNPSTEEETEIERALGIDVPTRDEMREIETSNRFYAEGGAHFMTALILQSADTETPKTSAITFILTEKRLVTVRYAEPKAFQIFADKACRPGTPCANGASVLAGLLEIMIQRQADHIERLQDEVEGLAPQIFGQKSAGGTRGRRLEVLLRSVGRSGDLTSRALESAVSFQRLLHYFHDAAKARGEDATLHARIESMRGDVGSLVDHLRSLQNRTAFLLDATLGMISTEQNQIIKLFSVMAVMLMPPTLVASVYGMNFKYMPELEWVSGYGWALGLMFVSALIPFIYFRRKGWL